MGRTSPFSDFRLVIDKGGFGDRPVGIYPAGHRLTGTVHITLKKETHVRAIKLQVLGKAVWNGKKTSKEMAVERIYFNRDLVLLERPPGQKEPGNFLWQANHPYELPWECPLPRSSPSSYEGPDGHVRYTCRLTFIEESTGYEWGVKRAINVVAPSPKTVVESLFEPVEHTKVCTTGKCCCCRRKFHVGIKLNKGIYMPGETIYGTVDIQLPNKKSSNKKSLVFTLTTQLVETLVHHDTLVKHEKSRVIATSPIGHSIGSFGPLIKIPPCAPSTLRHSLQATLPPSETQDTIVSNGTTFSNYSTLTKHPHALFNIDYELIISIDNGKMIIPAPVHIGSVPLTRPDAPESAGINYDKAMHYVVQDIWQDDDRNITILDEDRTFAPIYPVASEAILPPVHAQAPPLPKKLPIDIIHEEHVASKVNFSDNSNGASHSPRPVDQPPSPPVNEAQNEDEQDS